MLYLYLFVTTYAILITFSVSIYSTAFETSSNPIKVLLGIIAYKELYPLFKFLAVVSLIIASVLHHKYGEVMHTFFYNLF